MNKTTAAAVALAATVGAAQAGNLDRSGQSIAPLFETGNYAEFSFGVVSPDVSGNLAAPAPPVGSGDMAETYWQVGAAYKHQFNDNISFAFIYDQPFGADSRYPGGAYPLAGTEAVFDADALTVLGRYVTDGGIGVHGGFRIQKISAATMVPAVAGYQADAGSDEGVGYVIGASYEIPRIALRVALTYNSEIETEHSTLETSAVTPPGGLTSITEITSPQAVNLDFQTGIAPGTLVFGGVRWTDWSSFSIDPSHFFALAGRPFLSYSEDIVTYKLGVGKEFNDTWSGSIAFTYEPSEGAFITNLGPQNGRFGVTLGARYKNNGYSVSAGLNYTMLETARTVVSSAPLTTSRFPDNDVIGVGFKIGYHY